MVYDEVTWRSRDGSWRIRLRGIGIQGIQDSLGVQYGMEDYIGELRSQVDRSFVLNLNNISYILVTTQYFRISLGNTHWTYHGSLPKTPQSPNVLKLTSITTDYERYTDMPRGTLSLLWDSNLYDFTCTERDF